MANGTDIKWIKATLIEIKDGHKDMMCELEKTNLCLKTTGDRVTKIEQKQKDHFFWHSQMNDLKKHTDNLTRTQIAIIISVVNIITIVIISVLK